MSKSIIRFILIFIIYFFTIIHFYRKQNKNINNFFILTIILIVSLIVLVIRIIFDFSFDNLCYAYLFTISFLVFRISKLALNKSKIKKSFIFCIILFIGNNIFFYNNLPTYTYKEAIGVVENNLESKHGNVEAINVDTIVHNFWAGGDRHALFLYDFYVMAYQVNGKEILYLFDPYTGMNQQLNEDTVELIRIKE